MLFEFSVTTLTDDMGVPLRARLRYGPVPMDDCTPRRSKRTENGALLWVLVTLIAISVYGNNNEAFARKKSVNVRARELAGLWAQRGEPRGEMHLALAGLYASAGDSRAFKHAKIAQKFGISAVRATLATALCFRKQGRFDGAFSALIRVLAAHRSQPFALVELWKTLYEARLRGAAIQTDVEMIRERLEEAGMRFPAKLDLSAKAKAESKKITALAYNALMGGRVEYGIELFEAAIDLFPSYAKAHRGLGLGRLKQHDLRRATGAYLIYLDLAPDVSDADEVDRVFVRYWKERSRE